MPLPNFLIIGETKCGTTSLYDNLIQHPNILPSNGNGNDTVVDATVPLGVKEIRFFDKQYNKGWDWYQQCFPSCPEGFITGEASPTYFGRQTATDRILDVMKDVKLILMLRNPVDRLISHYNHKASIDRVFRDRYPTVEDYWFCATEEDYYLIERGVYVHRLENLIEMLGMRSEERLHVIFSEDFFSLPVYETSKVFQFLGLGRCNITPKHSRKGTTNKRRISDSVLSDMREYYRWSNLQLESVIELVSAEQRRLWR